MSDYIHCLCTACHCMPHKDEVRNLRKIFFSKTRETQILPSSSRKGRSSLLQKGDEENTAKSVESEIENLQSEQPQITHKKILPFSKKVSVILRIERSAATSTAQPLAEEASEDPFSNQAVNKSKSVQLSVMSRSYEQPNVYSSLPQLEPNMQATEVTLFNSAMPERFATLSRTKFRSTRSGSTTRREVGQSSIRHSKTFSSFYPVPVPKVTLKTIQNKENKVWRLKKQFEEPCKL